MSRSSISRLAAAAAAALLALAGADAVAQHQQHSQPDRPASPPPDAVAQRVTMEDLHAHGGVPQGWKFALPAGDPARGRQVFVELECYKCHAVRGEQFPQPSGEPKQTGPELSGMGAMHPAEYFAESILSPNRVIVEGPGFTGADGLSIMPSFTDSLSVAQWVDLVTYLKSLTSGGEGHSAHGAREQTVGDYTIRLLYVGAMPQRDHAAHGHHEGHEAAAPQPLASRAGHLMVFVTDRETSSPVPYLPVTATLRITAQSARTVKLAPMMGRHGFHYGAMVRLPPRGQRITLTVGPIAMQVVSGTRFKRPVSVVFEWPAP